MELDTLENTLFALPPIKRTVPTTITRITASITAYSAISWPSSSDQSLRSNLLMSSSSNPFGICADRERGRLRLLPLSGLLTTGTRLNPGPPSGNGPFGGLGFTAVIEPWLLELPGPGDDRIVAGELMPLRRTNLGPLCYGANPGTGRRCL